MERLRPSVLVLEPGGGAYRQCRGTASRALHGSGNTSCGRLPGSRWEHSSVSSGPLRATDTWCWRRRLQGHPS